jgi:DNA repair protein RecO (recombination protein O)
MGGHYRVTSINLKRQPLGEADLLLTLFTREQGLLRAIAKGAKKATSKLGGRSDLFVVNDMQLHQGRSLDTIIQAEMLHNFSHLGRDLGRLGSAQYWAEALLVEAVPGQAQPELFDTFLEHLGRLESCETAAIGGQLVHGLYRLLQISGVAPTVNHCVVSGRELFQEPASFSIQLGGLVAPEYAQAYGWKLTPEQVNALQWLPYPDISAEILSSKVWISIERFLRRYLEQHLQRTVYSAQLLDTALG